MKKSISALLLAIALPFVVFAQKDKLIEPTQQLTFSDSIRILLNNTKLVEIMTVGDGFGSVWANIGPVQQMQIQKQTKLMKKRGYKLRPHFVNYYAAIVAAQSIEKLDLDRFANFLQVIDKVLAKENSNQANIMFQQSRDFFKHHALNFQKYFHLKAVDDEYSFVYLEPKVIPNDTDQSYTPPAESDTISLVPWKQPIVQPEIQGAAIVFSKVTLNFTTFYDSAILKDTKGTFSLRDKLFVGERGQFDWSTAGLSADSVNYELSKYSFRTTQPYLRAQQGKLLYLGKLPGRVPGQFEFKSISHKSKATAQYPRFKSYENNITILGLGEFISYQGGFGMIGKNINSLSVNGEPATLEIRGNADKRFKAHASSIAFKDSLIHAANAKVTIYQGNDSITHPSTQVRFDRAKQKIIISKDRSSLRNAPFSSSFFGIDFNADLIRWNLLSDSLTMTIEGGGGISPMVIESHDFYSPDDLEQLRGKGLGFNAFLIFTNFAKKIKAQDFSIFELVTGNRTLEGIKMAADFLSQKGMILYNARTGKIHVRDKAMHLAQIKKGDVDYDNMKVQSLTDTIANATISLTNRSMVVHGVEEFNVSDSLNVIIKPDSSVITFLQNRDIKFNGIINAGNFEIIGKDFTFKYDSFFINLNHIDSIRFFIIEKNGNRSRVNNSLVIADSTAAAASGLPSSSNKKSGTLFINRPNNKSGRTQVPNYPRLDATAGGVIYFDRKEILNGAYDKSVLFAIPPFKMDSLNDADLGSINFDGKFISSGMFPPFQEKLHTMPDKSMGFNHTVPTKGYNLYLGEGRLFGRLNLNNSGLRAAGKIEYLAAKVESDDFIFYPDSVLSRGKSGELKEKQIGNITFPQVTFSDYQMKWYPNQDRLRLKNAREPFSFYKNTATLNGIITVSKTGLTGSGKLSTLGSEVSSKELCFAPKDFSARHAHFEVKTGNPSKPALAGNNVRLKFDLDKNIATINPEVEGVASIEFPYALFKTSIPQAKWDLTTQKIVMNKAPNVPIENSYFYTTRKELDSLRFSAEKAEYDIATQQLKVSGIPFIIVADAKITPANNEVLILENAKIGQLKNTTLVLDTLNGYHRLTEGVVDIISRKEFTGYATYQYVNAVNDTFNIKMTNFHLEAISAEGKTRKKSNVHATQQTVGNGSVADTDKILVAPHIFYKGDMVMYATRPALQLKGFIKLDLKKIKDYNTWLAYNQRGDEKDIYLDFDKTVTEEGQKATAGLHFAQDNSLYITFVFDKKDEGDEDFFLPSGSLFFDKESSQFKIEDRQKAAGEKLSGKVFAYNEEKEEVSFEGPINFFKNTNDFKLTASAIGSGSLITNEIKMNSLIMANMAIPDMAYQLMANHLLEVVKSDGVPEGLGDQTELLYKIGNLIGERVTKDYEQKSQQGYVSLGTVQGLIQPLVFSNVNLKWSQDRKAFYSEGTIGISNSNQLDINGAFEGFMEIRKNEDGAPVFHVFFKASPESWYYFGFEDNRLMVHSANQAFNELITKKSNARKAKLGQLVFIPGTDEEILSFVNRFRLQYYSLEAPYDLTSGTSSAKKKEKKKEEKKDDDGF
ncbi:MAG: hypothetical protein ORN54_11840 [Cyclobacteriaceae bacterium]|nr:hypothetical protein [Cyclobacteriaceae bacterium]